MTLEVEIELEDLDMGFDRTATQVNRIKKAEIQVGLFSKRLATRGAYHELGTSRIPSRPWLEPSARRAQPDVVRGMQIAYRAILAGADPKKTLKVVGDILANEAANTLRTGTAEGPSLAASTVKSKGSSTKLLDTGRMAKGVRSRVLKVRRK